MALTKCKECDHDVSTKASACPNCGTPDFLSDDAKELLRKERQKEQLKKMLEDKKPNTWSQSKKAERTQRNPDAKRRKSNTTRYLFVVLCIVVFIMLIRIWPERTVAPVQNNPSTPKKAPSATLDTTTKPQSVKRAVESKKFTEKEIADHKALGEKLHELIAPRYDDMEDITWYHAKGSKYSRSWNTDDDGGYASWIDGNVSSDCAVYPYIGKKDSSLWMLLYCGFESDDWLFFQKVIFLLDNTSRIEIEIPYSKRKTEILHDGRVKECCHLPVGDDLSANLRLIGAASKLRARFSGDQKYAEFILTEKEQIDILTILSYFQWLEDEKKIKSAN